MQSKFISSLTQHNHILVIPHTRHDGDALGSGLGLCYLITQLGKQAKILLDDQLPENLKWLPGLDTYGVTGSTDPAELNTLFDWADMVVLTDFSSKGRVTDATDDCIEQTNTPIAIIDHHPDGNIHAQIKCIDTDRPATCEVILHELHKADMLQNIPLDCATALYTGLITDTGSFKFRQTGVQTLEYAAELFKLGVNNTEIQTLLHDQNSLSRLHLMGSAMSNIEVMSDYPVALIHLSKSELTTARTGETNGLVNYALSIKGVELAVAAFDFPDQDGIKLSFRSSGDIPANQLAKVFKGGGHRNAAGGHSSLSLDQTLDKIKQHVHLVF